MFALGFSSVGRSARGGFLLWSGSGSPGRWANVGTAVLCSCISPNPPDGAAGRTAVSVQGSARILLLSVHCFAVDNCTVNS